jgi:colanic acid biosynthesis glycosyl transferase WcaI
MVAVEGFSDSRQDHSAHRQQERDLGLPLRILIFGINYAPEPIGIGPFTTGIAEHFAAEGHVVEVVTGLPHYPSWRATPVSSLRTAGNPSVRRYRHAIPRHPRATGRLAYESTWLVSASRGIVRGRYDAILGVVPSLSGALLALLASRRFGAPVGLVFQDVMGLAAAESGYAGGSAVAHSVARLEQFVARRADRVGVISDGFRRYFEEAGVRPDRISSLRNWARLGSTSESVAATRARLKWLPSDFICVHAGSMGQKQGLDNLLEASHLLRDTNIRVVLTGDGNDRERLTRRASELGPNGLSFLPVQPDGEFEAMLKAADVLVVNQREAVTEMALPSKLGTYFGSGRPVVAAVAANSGAAREVDAARAGRVVVPGDPRVLADALLEMRNLPRDERERLGLNGLAYAARYLTPEAAFHQYDCFLQGVAASRPAGRTRRRR